MVQLLSASVRGDTLAPRRRRHRPHNRVEPGTRERISAKLPVPALHPHLVDPLRPVGQLPLVGLHGVARMAALRPPARPFPALLGAAVSCCE